MVEMFKCDDGRCDGGPELFFKCVVAFFRVCCVRGEAAEFKFTKRFQLEFFFVVEVVDEIGTTFISVCPRMRHRLQQE